MVFQTELKSWCLVAFLLLYLPLKVGGQQTSQQPHTVRASADVTISAKPDTAQISISVYSQAAKAEAVSQENAALTSRVLTALKEVIGGKGQIKTSGFFASPQMQYGSFGGKLKIAGYEATNRVTVTLDDLGLVSKVIDTAANAGATQIQGVSFSLQNDQTIRAQALAQASRKAYDAAQAIAKALNLTVTGVLEAQTGSQAPIVVPMYGNAAQSVMVGEKAPAPTTPIEPGNIDIRANVTVTLEVR